ncbi:MAG: hypothetical protein SFV21_07300 [Rhodospirillaceae bacterium]|nr:hypothetical protein [Rhodospirillaceae bacterium]
MIAVFALHAAYLAQTLAPLPMELALPLDQLKPVRGVSVALSALAVVVTVATGRAMLRDAPAGAFAALPMALLPPFTAVAVSATPHPLAILLMALIVQAGLRGGVTTLAAAGSALAVIHPLGPGLAVLALAVAGALAGWSRAWRGAAAFVATMLVGLAFVAFTDVLPRREPGGWQLDLTAAGQGGVTQGLLLPYALWPVVFVLSGLALRSVAVRVRLGPNVVAASVAAMVAAVVAAVGLVLVVPAGQLLTAAALIVPLAIPASAPLIAWVRWVMPTVKSLAAWILFPVVMYSGFWVVLGPVEAGRFPYAQRGLSPPESAIDPADPPVQPDPASDR